MTMSLAQKLPVSNIDKLSLKKKHIGLEIAQLLRALVLPEDAGSTPAPT